MDDKRLEGKNIVVGVTGGIAVYKACYFVRLLKKEGANVDVIMTNNATKFVSPLTFETLSARPVTVDMFAEKGHWEVEHVSLAKKADLFIVCPATANIIGKYANGIADDMLSTTLMATSAPVIIAPAMNTGMYESLAVQQNIATLKSRNVHVLGTGDGFLACGDNGAGRMAEPEEIFQAVLAVLGQKKDLHGKKILITAGATAEKLDDVRYITNFSSGKMGISLAKRAVARGADVILILAKHTADVCNGVKVIDVCTTDDMYNAVLSTFATQDAVIMAAAPCDYRPESVSSTKIKAENLTIKFVKNIDIAKVVGQNKGKTHLTVFAAETDNAQKNAASKLAAKNADLAVLNVVKGGKVFGSDVNEITLLDKSGAISYPEMPKEQAADIILDRIAAAL